MPAKKLLILSDCPQLSNDVLKAGGWSVTSASDGEQARLALARRQADLIAVSLDLRCSNTASLILELCSVNQISAVVFCPPEKVDTLSYQFRSASILVLPSHTPKQIIVQTLDFLKKKIEQEHRLLDSLMGEKRKAQDEKLVSQAKIQLVSMCRWSEEKAHQYILKTAMDHSMTKASAARQIIARLERIASESTKNQRHAAA